MTIEKCPPYLYIFFVHSMLTTMFKDCYWQTNVMLKMREEYGKIKEPGLVFRIVFLFKKELVSVITLH